MAVNTVAFFLQEPQGMSSLGAATWPWGESGMYPEDPPIILWGQGTPDGDRAPFVSANKGSLYLQTDAADDMACLWEKVDEGGAGSDWIKPQTMVDQWGALVDISAAASEQVIFHAVTDVTITEIGIVWNEATAASGALEGDITIGVTTGGGEIVAATSYPVSKASGAYTALTIVDGEVDAGESVFASHDQAAGANGTYFIVAKYVQRAPA